MGVGIPRDWQARWGHSKAAAQRRDWQGCRRGWNRQFVVVATEAGRSGGCMFGFAAVDCAAVRNLGAVDAAEGAGAETAAVQSVDAVGREEAAAIAIRTAAAVEGKLGVAVVAAVAPVVVEEVVETLDMLVVAVVVAEEEDQEEEAGNTARLEPGSASRN